MAKTLGWGRNKEGELQSKGMTDAKIAAPATATTCWLLTNRFRTGEP